jgi:hypothetical protein
MRGEVSGPTEELKQLRKQHSTLILDKDGQVVAQIKIGKIVKLIISVLVALVLALVILTGLAFWNSIRIDRLDLEVQEKTNVNTSNGNTKQ